MLLSGTLVRPIDIFDLLLHSVPLMLLAWRLVVMAQDSRDKP
jgi:hypothetical protein